MRISGFNSMAANNTAFKAQIRALVEYQYQTFKDKEIHTKEMTLNSDNFVRAEEGYDGPYKTEVQLKIPFPYIGDHITLVMPYDEYNEALKHDFYDGRPEDMKSKTAESKPTKRPKS